ncbi:hypothetical protein PHSY_004187 [Pseudozyma hubeiensis SY62]|uniref:Restriction endonuclease type IV Mrr domain-containing protein n=1 Tax=Pseudozyma hubeiensis (strain SY62) TaxID=1305764 RepID=R9P5K1_PSEHS|nr:hypothetical protein PHSY_004187 [Pseudozyma hubeiensis SY62]GAC96604.1 hypothetical protein PHSY_004187 [Pseudozyma hubeiensis SY62]
MSWSGYALTASAAPLSRNTLSPWSFSRMQRPEHAFRLPARFFSSSTTQRKASKLIAIPPSSDKPQEAESSVARGTRYELLCGALLKQMFGMELERSGGAGDRGIDLRGWWQPPSIHPSAAETDSSRQRRIRIVAQCKCQDEGGKKMGPVLVREMEGVIFRASSPSPTSTKASGTVDGATIDVHNAPLAGILLSSSGFSKQALLQVRSSNVPLAAMHVLAQPQNPTGGVETINEPALLERCVSIVWNDRFGSPAGGLLEGGMEVRWVRSLSPRKAAAEGSMGKPVIYRGGKPLQK